VTLATRADGGFWARHIGSAPPRCYLAVILGVRSVINIHIEGLKYSFLLNLVRIWAMAEVPTAKG
jgi:hypothetical protein